MPLEPVEELPPYIFGFLVEVSLEPVEELPPPLAGRSFDVSSFSHGHGTFPLPSIHVNFPLFGPFKLIFRYSSALANIFLSSVLTTSETSPPPAPPAPPPPPIFLTVLHAISNSLHFFLKPAPNVRGFTIQLLLLPSRFHFKPATFAGDISIPEQVYFFVLSHSVSSASAASSPRHAVFLLAASRVFLCLFFVQ